MQESQNGVSELTETLLSRCTFPDTTEPVRCGVSGGADSVSLLWLAIQAGVNAVAVHVDHGLRENGDKEAQFVAEIAERFGAEFVSETVEVNATSDIEQQARIARHEILGPDAMLGHTADDQAETVLINLMRGSGVDGLAGIQPGPRHPILALRRFETEAICAELGIEPFVDPSNSDPRFQRNRVRNEVIPLLNEISDRDVVPLLNRTAALGKESSDFVASTSQGIDPTDTRTLQTYPAIIQAAVLREWLRDELGHPPSQAETERVLKVVAHEVTACEISGGRRVARTEGVLRVQ